MGLLSYAKLAAIVATVVHAAPNGAVEVVVKSYFELQSQVRRGTPRTPLEDASEASSGSWIIS